MKNIRFNYLLLLLPLMWFPNMISAQTAEGFFEKALDKQNNNLFELAIDDYSNAIKLDPKYEGAFLNRGVCYYELKKMGKAIEDYNKVIELNSTYPAVHLNRAIAKIAISDYEGALADLNLVISQKKETKLLASEYYQRAEVYIKLGKNNEACLDISKAKELGYKTIDEAFTKLCK